MERDIGLFFNPLDLNGVNVSFENKQCLTQIGGEGLIYRTQVAITHNGREKSIGFMILKELRDNIINGDDFPECTRENMLKKYLSLKKNGLPVIGTFRHDSAGRRYLMTDLVNSETVIFDRHNPSRKEKVNNLDEIKITCQNIATLAYRNQVYLGKDAYCLLFDKITGTGKPFLLDIGIGSFFYDSKSEIGFRDEASAVGEVEAFLKETIRR